MEFWTIPFVSGTEAGSEEMDRNRPEYKCKAMKVGIWPFFFFSDLVAQRKIPLFISI